ncbi:MAG: class B sortase [Clostridia bacterium]|nr:class B sortase [Clostridia bacterium]
MDEQPRRRRRQQMDDAAIRDMQPEQEKVLPQQPTVDAVSAEDGQTHHRRRRTAQTAEPTQSSETEKPAGQRARTRSTASAQKESKEVFWHPYEENAQAQEPKKRVVSNPMKAVSAIDDVVCKIGDACLAGIKWSGVALLFAVGFVVNGVGKLVGKAKPVLRSTGKKTDHRRSVHTGKRVSAAKSAKGQAGKTASQAPRRKTAVQQGDATIVPIKPEDYRGMGEQRSSGTQKTHKKQAKRVVRAPKKKVGPIYAASMALFICIALVSVYEIGSIVWRSVSTKRLSSSLSERYSELTSEDSGWEEEAQEPIVQVVYEEATPVLFVEYVGDAVLENTPEPVEEETTPAVQNTIQPKIEAVRTTKYHQVGGDALPEMEALYQDNRDLIGWLRMEGILDLPVVYKDNTYYLTRDFYKNKSASGTLFLDENHPFKENAQNLLLHGHNMKDGTMFGRLVQYETNMQFLKNNPFIQYSTLWRKEQYVIFAVMRVSLDVRSPEFFNYFTHHTFSSDTQFENYVRALQNRSEYSIPIDVKPTDALLTLSTCLDDDRLVIVARRLREGESKSELRHVVQLAARQ